MSAAGGEGWPGRFPDGVVGEEGVAVIAAAAAFGDAMTGIEMVMMVMVTGNACVSVYAYVERQTMHPHRSRLWLGGALRGGRVGVGGVAAVGWLSRDGRGGGAGESEAEKDGPGFAAKFVDKLCPPARYEY
ncbi:hypothetical protein BU17DRAFT_64738 [Hysterangium stoloniferum]|nr:hypothetical protein BU17DRAFT_64738 [Hysterangium stoloniferum]